MNKDIENNKFLDLNIGKILSDWYLWQAIREILSNSIDEHKIQGIEDKIFCNYDKSKKEVEIRDFGRGIESKNFIQSESNEKNNRNDIIGKFGIGLKDAIATFYRNDINIKIYSKNGIWVPAEKEKYGTDLSTIHMIESESNDKNFKGTKIVIIGIDEEQYFESRNQFLIFNDNQKIDSNKYGDVILKSNISSEIYINGMKFSNDEGFNFSYNITKLDKKLRKSFNRERTSISRDSYRSSILNILKNSTPKIWKEIRENNSDEYNFIDLKIIIFKHFNIYPATKKVIDKYPSFPHYLKSRKGEYEIVTEKEYQSFKNSKVETLEEFGRNFIGNYDGTPIKVESLTEDEQIIFKQSLDFVKYFKLNKNNIEIVLIENHEEAMGIFTGEIIQIVSRKALTSLETCLGVMLHELAHSYNDNKDGSIEFENDLTCLLGKIANILYMKKNN